MAIAAVQTAMNLEEKQNVHPFFSKPHKDNVPEQQPPAIEAAADNAHDDPDHEQHEKGGKGQKRRGRKPGSTNKKKESPAGKGQSLMERFAQPPRGQAAAENTQADTKQIPEEPTLEEDPNQDRRKRRKTHSPPPAQSDAVAGEVPVNGSLGWHQQLELKAGQATTSQIRETVSEPSIQDVTANIPPTEALRHDRHVTPLNDATVATNAGPLQGSASTSTTEKSTLKKKTIKVSKSGKLVSSPPKVEEEAIPPKKRRGRKPKLKAVPTITIIKYGSDAATRCAIGEKIEAILKSDTAKLRPVTSKQAPPKPSGPPKPTHPFFLGKSATKNNEATISDQAADSWPLPLPKAQKKSAVTPGKLKLESRGFHSSVDMPTFGLKSKRLSKQGGIIEAPWPDRETAHVRNLDVNMPLEPILLSKEPPLKTRKMKSRVLAISQEEDLVASLAFQLRSSIREQHDVSYSNFTPPKDVRLPTRLLTTGVGIQDKLRTQIVSLPSCEYTSEASGVHPAITTMFAGIRDNLTAFDLGKCESLSWVQKYAPKHASLVLQAGKEPTVLKDWLQSLTVLAVEGKHAGSKATEVTDLRKPPKKKRKKAQDDFIVDSDEEEEEDMIELPRSALDDHASSSFMPTSLRRARWTRSKNVVLISGPHGCGKSAMVHAVARDLGFEVFEINSGSRRSGKDIQDKVGDMTENHLVSHRRNETPANSELPTDDTDTERHSNALQKDLDSGRQGTMMSFFKSKGPVREQPKPISMATEPREKPSFGQTTLPISQPHRKSQKQSLILFEEADILYDEDQGFWAQVIRLAAQSKRPIIITCTNEALIPTHELPLAAILRIPPPPVSLATDYMIALAGNEGHILDRDAVSTLYRLKNCDLRASITELHLWCQMSVGDRKGGLEWVYQRWPPGKDVDESGRLLRVASEGTYVSGMGCLSYNVFQSQDHIGYDRTEELLKETWQEWGINPSEWSGDGNTGTVTKATSRTTIDDLKRLDAIADSISAADVYCCTDTASYQRHFEQPTDPSLPLLPEKARLSYTLAAPVLQVDHITDFNHFDTDMLTQTHLLTRRALGGRQVSNIEEPMPIPTTEQDFVTAIRNYTNRQKLKSHLSWPDFSQAFDILAYPPDALPALNTSYNLTASSFDRTFKIVVEDLAPYVRSIVASELVLENQRIRLGNLLSEGGIRSNKRQRTTRAARTALEGGSRDTKRRERWFGIDLNRTLVMGTAGKSWAGMGTEAEEAETESRTEGSLGGTQEE